MILNHIPQENDDLEAILSDDDSEVIKGIAEADLSGFEAVTEIVRDVPALEISEAEIEVARCELEKHLSSSDKVTAQFVNCGMDHTPPENYPFLVCEIDRLFQHQKIKGNPPWLESYLHFMLNADDLHNHSSAAKAAGTNHMTVSYFFRILRLPWLFHSVRTAALNRSGDTMERELLRRAMAGPDDKYSATLLIFGLKGAKPDKYKEGSQIAVQVNNGPTSWSIDPVTIADKPRT